MKTFEVFYEEVKEKQLQEMEYQAPPKVPTPPIERRAKQPEQRKSPGDFIKPVQKNADFPTDPKDQRERDGKNTRRLLRVSSEAIKKARKGKDMASKQTRAQVKDGRPTDSRPAPPIKSIFK